MGKSFIGVSVFFSLLFIPHFPFGIVPTVYDTAVASERALAPTPLPPNTAKSEPEKVGHAPVVVKKAAPAPKQAPIVVAKVEKNQPTTAPVSVSIPSIKLNSPIQGMGVTASGELDVPLGSTKKVGWYKDGVKPGEVGSAVFDAHVYAAFAKLRYVKVGDDIYVTTETKQKLHFRVEQSMVYPVGDVPLDVLFSRSDAKRLNLITCAGKLTKDRSTYEKRLIVYAKLVE